MCHCLNCGTELTGAYCHNCGQRATVGRLTVKTALVDDAWSAVRMDRRVWPTVFALFREPWVVIADYIHGRRVRWTQPVRLIIILCFVNLMMQLFFPTTEEKEAVKVAVAAVEESGPLRLWHLFQRFCEDSAVTVAMLESVILAPLFIVQFRRWGSRRFNIAEYSTAYLYLAAAAMAWDIFMILPERYITEWLDLLFIPWWIYVVASLVTHAFPTLRGWRRVWKITWAMFSCGLLFAILHTIIDP